MTPSKKVRNRTFRGVTAEDRRAERRQRLLDAGHKLFGARGYRGVTVREVCAEAKLTERYFYESFPNLDALFDATYAQINAQLKQVTFGALARAPREADAMAEAAVRAFFAFGHEDPGRGRILLLDPTNMGEQNMQRSQGAIRDFVELMRSLIAMLYPNAQIDLPFFRADYMAQGLVGVMIFLYWRWAGEEFATPLEDVVQNAMLFYRALNAHAEHLKRVGSAGAAPTAKIEPPSA